MKTKRSILSPLLVLVLTLPAVAVDTSVLPGEWRFSIDAEDAGVDGKWYDPDHDDGTWPRVSTHRWKGWQQQGLPRHEGFAWYRVAHEVPAVLGKKHVYLYFGGVGDAAWVWVNGRDVGKHELITGRDNPSWVRQFALEVTDAVRAGEVNRFSLRVQNVAGSVAGIWQPVYLFARDQPMTLEEMREQAVGLNRQVLAKMDPIVRFDIWTGYAYAPTTLDAQPPSREPSIIKEQDNGSQARSFDESVRLRGAAGEYVPLAVHVRNRSDMPITVRLDFLPVRHQSLGLLLTMDRVEVRRVDYILTARRDLVPDPLPRLGSNNGLRIAAEQTETFVVLIDTRGMPAGSWKGQLHLTPLRAGPFLDVPFQLDIAAVALPDRLPIRLNMWTNTPDGSWMRDGRGHSDAYYALMRRTGVNVVQSIIRPRPILDDAGDLVAVDFVEFDRMLARRFVEGDELVLGHYSGSAANMKEHYAPPNDPERWKPNWAKYVRLLARHIRENHGIPYDGWSIYLCDENIGPFFVELAKLVREGDPKVRIWANRIEDLETMKKAEPYIDVFAPYSPWLSDKGRGHGMYPESEKLMDEKGVPWWPYIHAWWQSSEKTAFPRAQPSAAHDTLRMHAWFTWKLKADGFGYWVYIIENYVRRYSGYPSIGLGLLHLPYNNVGFVYFGHDGPITSRRLEAYREGWEDYKLLWVIDRAAGADGQQSPAVEQARNNLAAAVDDILANKSDVDRLNNWRHQLLDDATVLCGAAPLDIAIDEIDVARDRIDLKCSASKPVRVWTWVDRGRNERGFIEPAATTDAPVVEIRGLVPGETCKLTLVFSGPEGQQKVLTREVTTEGWGAGEN